jgi:hypothetical protein
MAHIQPTSIPIQRMLRPRSFLPVGPENLDDDPIALTACTAFNLLPMFHLVLALVASTVVITDDDQSFPVIAFASTFVVSPNCQGLRP